jgi:hypothetical protein
MRRAFGVRVRTLRMRCPNATEDVRIRLLQLQTLVEQSAELAIRAEIHLQLLDVQLPLPIVTTLMDETRRGIVAMLHAHLAADDG